MASQLNCYTERKVSIAEKEYLVSLSRLGFFIREPGGREGRFVSYLDVFKKSQEKRAQKDLRSEFNS